MLLERVSGYCYRNCDVESAVEEYRDIAYRECVDSHLDNDTGTVK